MNTPRTFTPALLIAALLSVKVAAPLLPGASIRPLSPAGAVLPSARLPAPLLATPPAPAAPRPPADAMSELRDAARGREPIRMAQEKAFDGRRQTLRETALPHDRFF